MNNIVASAWRKYRARKSIIGIITDFMFLAIVLVFVIPPLRFGVSVYISRIALREPNPIEDIYYITDNNVTTLTTTSKKDTTILQEIPRLTIVNFGNTTTAQSCAELKSLNKLQEKYKDEISIYFITDEEVEEVTKYFKRHKYTIKPLFYQGIEYDISDHDMIHELQSSVPSTIVIAPNKRIIIKKFGAARWVGKKIETIIDKYIDKKGD